MTQMMIKSPSEDPGMILLYRTTSTPESITLPLPEDNKIPPYTPLAYNFTIDWGDGSTIDTITAYDQAELTHSYATPDDYTVVINGTMPSMHHDREPAAPKLIDILQWGDTGLETLYSAFEDCINLVTLSATDTPILDNVTDLGFMFSHCTLFDSPINDWDVSTIENFRGMFWEAVAFNQDLNSWDISSANNLLGMFQAAAAFNGNITGWDVSNVTTMQALFSDCVVFNQDISDWDVSSVLDFGTCFRKCYLFNQDIGGWAVSAATSMFQMFYFCTAFNQDISGWDVTNSTNFSNMFHLATSFSTENYDLLLNAWSLLTLSNGESIRFASSYTIATSQAARDIITDTYGWSIVDLGGI